ncbi:MAG: DUF4097 family beta strand repeat-containing protein, partial [Verrucomicrobiia bacterium]
MFRFFTAVLGNLRENRKASDRSPVLALTASVNDPDFVQPPATKLPWTARCDRALSMTPATVLCRGRSVAPAPRGGTAGWISLAGALVVGFQALSAAAGQKCVEEQHTIYPLAPEGRVRLENVNGSVRFKAWDRAEIELHAVKRANKQADLESVKIEVESKPDEITIRTQYPKPASGWFKSKQNSTTVDYVVTVPRKAALAKVSNVNGSIEIQGLRGRVNASTVNGRLRGSGLAGDTSLSTVNGALEAEFEELAGARSVSLSTVNGKASVVLPINADATISASTVNGEISADKPFEVKKQRLPGRSFEGTLGKGSAKVKISTVNGAIAIRLVETS